MTYLRWILCFPVGIIAGGVVQILYPAISVGRFETNYFFIWIASLIAGGISVYVTALIAPTPKKIRVAIALCIISLINLGVAITYQVEFNDTLINLLQCLGSIFITAQIYRRKILFN